MMPRIKILLPVLLVLSIFALASATSPASVPISSNALVYKDCAGSTVSETTMIIPSIIPQGGTLQVITYLTNLGRADVELSIRHRIEDPDERVLLGNGQRVYLKAGMSLAVVTPFGATCAGFPQGQYHVDVGLAPVTIPAPCSQPDGSVYDERNNFIVTGETACQGY